MSVRPIAVRHMIAGEWVGEPDGARENPARRGETVSTFPEGDAVIVGQAVDAAQDAFAGWSATPAPARGELLLRASVLLDERREEAAATLSREEGKTLAEARDEVMRGVRMLRFYAGETWHLGGLALPSMLPRTDVTTRREPLGPVGIITPWNFPVAIPVWKAAPALAAGNTVVLKPATSTPATTALVVECLVAAGLPHGVLNVIYGSGAVAGVAIVADSRIAAVSFTGSTSVGRRVNEVAARRMARVQLEMGGKNSLVVLPDADPDFAADVCVRAAFGLTGQACTATSRMVVFRENADAVIDAVRRRAATIVVGDGCAEGTTMGPVVSDAQLQTDLDYIANAVGSGAEVVYGGGHSGHFLEPTLLAGAGPDSAVAREEVFGPVLVVLTAETISDAIDLVNATDYGLVAGIVTDDLVAAMEFADGVRVGVVKVNRPTTGTDLNAPFGGVKDSSNDLFREQGVTAMDFYTRIKTVYLGY